MLRTETKQPLENELPQYSSARAATAAIMAYQPIENYGVIGNLRTAALIGVNGSIDWFPFPHFDSASIFGAILDEKKGGYFRIFPARDEVTHKQVYWPDTNILVTRFFTTEGVGEITDFMPMPAGQTDSQNARLIRRVRVLRGIVNFRLECQRAFNYARDQHATHIARNGARFCSSGLRLVLKSDIRLQHSGTGVSAEFTISEGTGKTSNSAK